MTDDYLNSVLECCVSSNDLVTEFIVFDSLRCTTYSLCADSDIDGEDIGSSTDLILFACPVYIKLYVDCDGLLCLNSIWSSKASNHFITLCGSIRCVAGKLHDWGLVANDNYNVLNVVATAIYTFITNGYTNELEKLGDDDTSQQYMDLSEELRITGDKLE